MVQKQVPHCPGWLQVEGREASHRWEGPAPGTGRGGMRRRRGPAVPGAPRFCESYKQNEQAPVPNCLVPSFILLKNVFSIYLHGEKQKHPTGAGAAGADLFPSKNFLLTGMRAESRGPPWRGGSHVSWGHLGTWELQAEEVREYPRHQPNIRPPRACPPRGPQE